MVVFPLVKKFKKLLHQFRTCVVLHKAWKVGESCPGCDVKPSAVQSQNSVVLHYRVGVTHWQRKASSTIYKERLFQLLPVPLSNAHLFANKGIQNKQSKRLLHPPNGQARQLESCGWNPDRLDVWHKWLNIILKPSLETNGRLDQNFVPNLQLLAT